MSKIKTNQERIFNCNNGEKKVAEHFKKDKRNITNGIPEIHKLYSIEEIQ